MNRLKRHYIITVSLFTALICCISCANTVKSDATTYPLPKSDKPLKVIIETDMGNDIDDAIALAVAHKAMDEGKIEILAVGCHKLSPTAARFTDAVNTYYGHPDIAVAMSQTPVKEFSDYVDYTSVVDEMDFKCSGTPVQEPVKLYRQLLSEADDNSITFISLGFGTTLAQLLDSPADGYSPLAGKELIAKKVNLLSIMAGSYGEKKRAEYNVTNDIPAMQKVFSEWPGVIVQNPFELGKQVMFPGELAAENLGFEEPDPVAEAYKRYKTMPYDRPGWDILSVIWLLEPELFTISAPGVVTVDKDGYTYYTPADGDQHYVLSATIDQPQALQEYMVKMAVK